MFKYSIILCLVLVQPLFAQQGSGASEINAFMVYQDSLRQADVKLRLDTTTDDGKYKQKNQLYTLGEEAKIVIAQQPKGALVMLVRVDNESAWLSNKRTRKPLKIGFAQKIQGSVNLEDVIGIDLRSYTEISDDEDGILMQVLSEKRLPFSYIRLFTLAGQSGEDKDYDFKIIFYDRNKNALREGLYKTGTLSGYKLFVKIKMTDLRSDDAPTYMDITKVSVHQFPARIFQSANMNQILNFIDD